jgi:hypothetical protein
VEARVAVGWAAFEDAAPEPARAGRRLFAATGIVFLATIRRDGGPRLHPVVPVFAGSGLYVAISRASPKRRDLLRDGCYALHASLGPDDEELALDGTAILVTDNDRRAAVVSAAGHTIHPDDAVFELRVGRCLWTVWENVGQPNTRPIRERWEAG